MRGERPQAVPSELTLAAEDSIDAASRKLARAFVAAGIEEAERDARFLLQGILNLEAAELIKSPERRLADAAALLGDAARRRLRAEPVSRILGERMFYGRAFEVTPDVLDPRAETETLIDAALQLATANGWHRRPMTIADIGIGSGAILVTLLKELPLARGVGTDISSGALGVALRNAGRHGVADRMQVLNDRGLPSGRGHFDLIVSNPPYIPTSDIVTLPADVRAYDPVLALDGGIDGLQIFREIARDISGLGANTVIALEIGAGQENAVANIFKDALCREGVYRLSFVKDLGGHVRCVTMEVQI